MSKVFPQPKDLPAGSQPFARETIARIEGAELDLSATKTELLATIKGLGATVQNLSEQLVTQQAVVSDLQARKTAAVFAGYSVSTGVLPKDNNFYNFGTPISVSIDTPGIAAGYYLVVTYGATEILVNSRGVSSSVAGRVLLTATGPGLSDSQATQVGASRQNLYSVPAANTFTLNTGPGVFTMTAQFQAWCSNISDGDCEARFTDPYITVEVVR